MTGLPLFVAADSVFAAQIGARVVAAGCVATYRAFDGPADLALACEAGEAAAAIVIDHRVKSETADAVRRIRAKLPATPLIVAFNGETDPKNPSISFGYVQASCFVPRAVLLSEIVWILGIYRVGRG